MRMSLWELGTRCSVKTWQAAAPTCSVATSGPPFTQAGTYFFSYAAQYTNGGLGTLSFPSASSCTANGTTQQIRVSIPSSISGATGYIFYRNSSSTSGGFQFQTAEFRLRPGNQLICSYARGKLRPTITITGRRRSRRYRERQYVGARYHSWPNSCPYWQRKQYAILHGQHAELALVQAKREQALRGPWN